jgi:hypothetical protein
MKGPAPDSSRLSHEARPAAALGSRLVNVTSHDYNVTNEDRWDC